jgi:methyl-accepting chemotaxis protein
VAEAAKSTSGGASDTQTAAGELAQMAAELQGLVGQFKYSEQSAVSGKQALPKDRSELARAKKQPLSRPPGVTVHSL